MMLITGACGYIGSTLVSQLVHENDLSFIRVLDNLTYTGESLIPVFDHVEIVKGDIRNPDVCIEALKDVSILIHLAAIVGEKACAKNEELARETNLYATRQLWELAKDSGVTTFIFASTCSNYGKADFATEETELNPLGLYAETKVEAEKWMLAQDADKMDTIILRFATAFGLSPRMRWDLLINQFILDAYLCKEISVYNPNAQRPYVHIKDIARMIVKALWMAEPVWNVGQQIINIGGYNRSKIRLAEYAKYLMPCIHIETTETGKGRDYAVDFSKIRSYGIVPKITPEMGMNELVGALPLFDNLLARKWVNA